MATAHPWARRGVHVGHLGVCVLHRRLNNRCKGHPSRCSRNCRNVGFRKTVIRYFPGEAPDDGTDIRRCVSRAMVMARPTNDSNLATTPSRSAGCGSGSLYTRYLCTSRLPASWNNRASTAIPDTSGRSALSHKSRGTVHGGNDLDTFSKSRVADPLCLSLKCSRHSLTEPFQTAHHSTGQRQSWPRSRWQHIICNSNDDSVVVLHTGQQPGLACRYTHSGCR